MVLQPSVLPDAFMPRDIVPQFTTTPCAAYHHFMSTGNRPFDNDHRDSQQPGDSGAPHVPSNASAKDSAAHLPRRADALRGNVSRLVSANRQRVAQAEAEGRQVRLTLAFQQRKRELAARIGTITLAMVASELDALAMEMGDDDAAANVPATNVPAAGAVASDFTASDLFDALERKLDMDCHACGYYLFGLPAQGKCPECGASYHTGVIKFDDLRAVLADQLKLPMAQVTPELCVLRRLRQLCVEDEDRRA